MKIFRKSKVNAAKSTPALHSAFDGLDDRFDFDLDDEFEIYVGNALTPCYTVDSTVFGNGAGLSYTIVTPIIDGDHWQMDDWVQRGLDEYFKDLCTGSDYTYGLGATERELYAPDGVPDIDAQAYYVTEVEIVPFTNIGPYGDYGIDAGYPNDEE